MRTAKNDVVIANSDVVSGLACRPVAVEGVKQAVLTSGRKREYICHKKIDVIPSELAITTGHF